MLLSAAWRLLRRVGLGKVDEAAGKAIIVDLVPWALPRAGDMPKSVYQRASKNRAAVASYTERLIEMQSISKAPYVAFYVAGPDALAALRHKASNVAVGTPGAGQGVYVIDDAAHRVLVFGPHMCAVLHPHHKNVSQSFFHSISTCVVVFVLPAGRFDFAHTPLCVRFVSVVSFLQNVDAQKALDKDALFSFVREQWNEAQREAAEAAKQLRGIECLPSQKYVGAECVLKLVKLFGDTGRAIVAKRLVSAELVEGLIRARHGMQPVLGEACVKSMFVRDGFLARVEQDGFVEVLHKAFTELVVVLGEDCVKSMFARDGFLARVEQDGFVEVLLKAFAELVVVLGKKLVKSMFGRNSFLACVEQAGFVEVLLEAFTELVRKLGDETVKKMFGLGGFIKRVGDEDNFVPRLVAKHDELVDAVGKQLVQQFFARGSFIERVLKKGFSKTLVVKIADLRAEVVLSTGAADDDTIGSALGNDGLMSRVVDDEDYVPALLRMYKLMCVKCDMHFAASAMKNERFLAAVDPARSTTFEATFSQLVSDYGLARIALLASNNGTDAWAQVASGSATKKVLGSIPIPKGSRRGRPRRGKPRASSGKREALVAALNLILDECGKWSRTHTGRLRVPKETRDELEEIVSDGGFVKPKNQVSALCGIGAAYRDGKAFESAFGSSQSTWLGAYKAALEAAYAVKEVDSDSEDDIQPNVRRSSPSAAAAAKAKLFYAGSDDDSCVKSDSDSDFVL